MAIFFTDSEARVLRNYIDVIDDNYDADNTRAMYELLGVIRFKLDNQAQIEISAVSNKTECDVG